MLGSSVSSRSSLRTASRCPAAAQKARLRLAACLVAALAVVAVVPQAASAALFAPKTDFPLAGDASPTAVALGDFNVDGKPDLVTANPASSAASTVSVLLGNGSGNFGLAVDFPAGVGAGAVAVGDFNVDGKPDLATANGGANTVSVLLGNGSGGFGAKTDFPAGARSSAIAVDDLNLDGKPDLATANGGANTVSVLLGNGSGGFAPKADFAAGKGPASVAIGDLNLDGKPDLAVASEDSGNVSVLLGDGSGGFGPKTGFAVSTIPASVAIGDLNGDGKSDLAAVGQVTVGPLTVSVLLGKGNGNFDAETTYPAGPFSSSIAIDDLNLDGKPDLAVGNVGAFPGSVSILLGKGDGSFKSNVDFETGMEPVSVAAGDLNLDGKPDLAVASNEGSVVSVLLGTGGGGLGSGSPGSCAAAKAGLKRAKSKQAGARKAKAKAERALTKAKDTGGKRKVKKARKQQKRAKKKLERAKAAVADADAEVTSAC